MTSSKSSLTLALASIIGTGVVVSACGHLRTEESARAPAPVPERNVRPAWVERRLGRDGNERDEIFAVGASPAHVGDESLAREAADDDARSQLRRVLDGCGSSRNPGSQRMAGMLAGSEVKDRWHDAESDTWFSLAAIAVGDASDVKDTRAAEAAEDARQPRAAADAPAIQPRSPTSHRKTRGRSRKRSGDGGPVPQGLPSP